MPAVVTFQEKWQIGVALVDQAAELPHGWVAADDEFGRITAFRRQLRQRRQCYVLDVPASTWVRDLEARVRRQPGQVRRHRKPAFERVDEWAAHQPQTRWRKLLVRDGEKGPVEVEALCVSVHTKADSRICTDEERLLVIRTQDAQPEVSFALCHADRRVPVPHIIARHELVRSLLPNLRDVISHALSRSAVERLEHRRRFGRKLIKQEDVHITLQTLKGQPSALSRHRDRSSASAPMRNTLARAEQNGNPLCSPRARGVEVEARAHG